MSIDRRTLLRGAALLLAAAATLTSGPAMAGPKRVQVLGAAAPTRASCPQTCFVEARVTAFQTRIGSRRSPFVVRRAGRLVAWSVKLGRPSKEDRRFFNEEFGGSKARLSVLKPERGRKRKLRYRLVAQSPVVKLAPFFGEIATFSLARPLPVRKARVVALTIPTWAPAFAIGRPRSTQWRGSRVPKRGGCYIRGGAANVKAGEPHADRGSLHAYRCTYRGSRLLYTARLLAKP